MIADNFLIYKDCIFKIIESIDKKYTAIVCGSFRRGNLAFNMQTLIYLLIAKTLNCFTGAKFSSDIDILLTHPSYVSEAYKPEEGETELIVHSKDSSKHFLSKIIKELQDTGFITDTIANGDTKYMVY